MKILLTGAYRYTEEKINKIKDLGFEVDFLQFEMDELNNPEKYDGVVCNGLFLHHDIRNFANLKFIQLTSAGMDRVPLDYLKYKNISIYNACGVYAIPMAEWIVLKILEICKNSFALYRNQQASAWEKERNLLELTDKKALIIGAGAVGRETSKRLKAFGCKVTGMDICKLNSEHFDDILSMDKLDEQLKISDFVILALPLTDDTYHLLNKEKMSIMRDDSILINVSRGGIICEDDLIYHLDKGKFRGVALDVFENEPLEASDVLWQYENVIITPHNSFVGDKVSERMYDVIINNLKEVMRGTV